MLAEAAVLPSWNPHTSMQASKLLVPVGVGPPCLQQLLWLQVVYWQAGPKAPTACRLCSPVTAAAAMAPGSQHLASRPQNSHCLQAWIPHACSSCHGSWKPMPQHK
jgi:cytochrome c553